MGNPGRNAEALIQASAGTTLTHADDLPARAWKEARTIWITDLASVPTHAPD